jgi:hypothetical protein
VNSRAIGDLFDTFAGSAFLRGPEPIIPTSWWIGQFHAGRLWRSRSVGLARELFFAGPVYIKWRKKGNDRLPHQ